MADGKTLVTLGAAAAAVGGVAYVARQKSAAEKYREKFIKVGDQYTTPETDWALLPQIQRTEMIKQNGREQVGPSPYRADYFYPSITGIEAAKLFMFWDRAGADMMSRDSDKERWISTTKTLHNDMAAALKLHASHTGCCGTSYAEQRLKCGWDGMPPGSFVERWTTCKGTLSLASSVKFWDAIDKLAYSMHTYASYKPDSYWTTALEAAGLALNETGATMAIYLAKIGSLAGKLVNDAAGAAGRASASFIWSFVAAGGIGVATVVGGYLLYRYATK